MNLKLNGKFPMAPHEGLKLEDALGKEILCDDGERRTVVAICPAYGKFGWALVNSSDGTDGREPYAGHLVYLPDLFAQLRGEPMPPEERERFRKIAESFKMEWQSKERNPFSWEKNRKQKKATKLLN